MTPLQNHWGRRRWIASLLITTGFTLIVPEPASAQAAREYKAAGHWKQRTTATPMPAVLACRPD